MSLCVFSSVFRFPLLPHNLHARYKFPRCLQVSCPYLPLTIFIIVPIKLSEFAVLRVQRFSQGKYKTSDIFNFYVTKNRKKFPFYIHRRSPATQQQMQKKFICLFTPVLLHSLHMELPPKSCSFKLSHYSPFNRLTKMLTKWQESLPRRSLRLCNTFYWLIFTHKE